MGYESNYSEEDLKMDYESNSEEDLRMKYKNCSQEKEDNDAAGEESEEVDNEEVNEEEEESEEVDEEEVSEEEEEERGSKYKRSQFIDDVSDEDDEEEEAPRKKRYRRASEFIDDEVAVASDDEEEDTEGGEEDFIHDEGLDMIEEEDRERKPRRAMRPEYDQQEDDVENLEKFIQQRYGSLRHEYEELEFDKAETTDVEQRALLPSVKDPKLWMVKCHVGHEREASICLMQKFVDMNMHGKPLLIKSAIAREHLRGYLYVESDREAYVREAIKGMRMIFQKEVKLVPIKEMTEVLSVEKKSVEIEQDTWVRVKNGVYKGDLAKVVDVDHVRQQSVIQLVPRVDLQALALRMSRISRKGCGDCDVKNKPRPAPRFISIQELQDSRIPVERKRDHAGEYFECFGGMQFKDGYLYKRLSLKSIDSNCVVPSFDEFQKFQKPTDEGGTDVTAHALMSKRKIQFVKGDTVVVVQGDLKNLMGYVEKVDDDDIFVRPKDKELQGSTLVFKDKQLCKFFKTGDHVKVIAGTHEGATGMIVGVGSGSVVILSDTTKEDIKVFTADIVESSEVTSGLNKIGHYELHDLVLLDQSTVGMIIEVLQMDSCQVLRGNPDRADLVVVKLRDMRRKIFDRKTNAQDRDSNVISLKDVVRVVHGPFKGKEGPVEHINRGILFIHDRHHLENGGFFCTRGIWCVALAAGSRNRIDRGPRQAHSDNNYNGAFQAPVRYLQSPSYRPRFPQPFHRASYGGGGEQMGCKRHHGLVAIGTTLKIRTGPFKGYRGRVVDATDQDVRIELESQMKVITLRRDQLSDPLGRSRNHYHDGSGAAYRGSPRSRYDARNVTPDIQPSNRTPLHSDGFMTPMRDPAATPMHGMTTPIRDRDRNPRTGNYSMNTLSDGSSWNQLNPSTSGYNINGTPQYQPTTPAGGRLYDSPTPGGGGWANTPSPSSSLSTEAGTPRKSIYTASYRNIPGTPHLPGT